MEWPHVLASMAANASSRAALIGSAVDLLRTLLRARAGGIGLEENADEHTVSLFGIRDCHAREYMAHWRSFDPVLGAATTSRSAMRDTDVRGGTDVASSPFCADFGRRVGVRSYLVAPIYGASGDVVGAIHLGRASDEHSFDPEDVNRVTAFSAFLSVMLAGHSFAPLCQASALAPREYQVALMAARGLSNPAIAENLGLARETIRQTLRRVYRKTSVLNRTQLAAYCTRSGWLDSNGAR